MSISCWSVNMVLCKKNWFICSEVWIVPYGYLCSWWHCNVFFYWISTKLSALWRLQCFWSSYGVCVTEESVVVMGCVDPFVRYCNWFASSNLLHWGLLTFDVLIVVMRFILFWVFCFSSKMFYYGQSWTIWLWVWLGSLWISNWFLVIPSSLVL